MRIVDVRTCAKGLLYQLSYWARSDWGDSTGLGAQGHQWILYENVGHWHSFILSIFLSFFRLEREKVAP